MVNEEELNESEENQLQEESAEPLPLEAESTDAPESIDDPINSSSAKEEELNESEENQLQEESAEPLPLEAESTNAPESIDDPISSSSAKKVLAAAQKKSSEEDDGRAWYVIHCYSGYEKKVRHNLEQRIETMGMKDMIFDVVIPTQEEIEVREGKRRSIERHVFPGYVLVNLILTEESWYVVRNTPGVTGFVGMGNDPTPLRDEEVTQILKRMEAEAPHLKVSFKSGERVRIIDGPFNDFRGTVSEIDIEHAKVTIMVNFFGRETPVELDYLQVERS